MSQKPLFEIMMTVMSAGNYFRGAGVICYGNLTYRREEVDLNDFGWV